MIFISAVKGTFEGKNERKNRYSTGDSSQTMDGNAHISAVKGTFEGKNERKNRYSTGDSSQIKVTSNYYSYEEVA